MSAFARLFLPSALAVAAWSPVALAQDDLEPDTLDAVVQDDEDDQDDESGDDSSDDDDLDDILGGDREDTVEQERDAVRSGDIDDRIGVRSEAILEAEEAAQRRVIRTIQRKNFKQLGRFEITPHFAFVTNDPFLNRYIIGTNVGYHATEIFAVEANLAFSPDLGSRDWKQITHQLVENNHVSPDISKLIFIGNATAQFSPIYGKVAFAGRNIIGFNIYGLFGMGLTQTHDDLEALQAEDGDNQLALNTEVQWHPTTNFGGGARVVLNDWFAVRMDGRSLVYIETVNSDVLEMKNNFVFSMGASFFIPSMDR